MIRFETVSKQFGNRAAVTDISFQANEKEVLVLLGPSGCGKTTTLKMINRLIEPDNGTIRINGIDIREKKVETLRRSIGFVMQHAGLFPHYTVRQNISILPDLLKWNKKETAKKVDHLIGKLHLPAHLLESYPHQLSGGQQQRVGIARALIANTPVLLMDEPFGALDNITRADIHAEFKSLDELRNKTIILVTHDVQEAFELGNRIAIMDKGKIIQIATPKEILYQPKNDFVKQFFESNRLLLEYKTARIGAISAFLPDVLRSQINLPAETTVWEALEMFSSNSHTCHSYDALTNAFNEYRKKQFQ